jgi:serine/threonine protein kinase
MFLPNFVCACVAVLPSRLLEHLGRRIRDANELGNYQLVSLLGRGGMGEVWIAEHRLLARSAAIKLIRPELLGSGTQTDVTLRRRFRAGSRSHRCPQFSAHHSAVRLRRERRRDVLLRDGTADGPGPRVDGS